MRRIFLILIAAMSYSCDSDSNAAAYQATICYLPIGNATYVPMTFEDLEETCPIVRKFSVQQRAFRKFDRLVESMSEGVFDENVVRAKITLPNENVLWIDNEGGVKTEEHPDRRFNDHEWQKAIKLLDKIAGYDRPRVFRNN